MDKKTFLLNSSGWFLGILFSAAFATGGLTGYAHTSPPDSTNVFRPGKVFRDTDGNPIKAMGGGFLYEKGAYFWFGEYKYDWGKVNSKEIACYKSTDLYNWKYCGNVLPGIKQGM